MDTAVLNSSNGVAETASSPRKEKRLHDPSVTFEEYVYYAKIERAHEETLPAAEHPLRSLFGKKTVADGSPSPVAVTSGDEKEKANHATTTPIVSDDEWYHASRALKTASYGAVFYLITTDVLGPWVVPWAMSQMGYGPGIALFTVFGALAFYTGIQLWRMFLRLDSSNYPLRSYGDLAFRVYGRWARHVVNILQSIQLVLFVGLIILVNGQSLYQISPNICFIVCCVIWAICGMVLGQIRTLQRFGWIAHLAIWMNVSLVILTMVVIAHNPPNYIASAASNGRDQTFGPIQTYAGAPPYSEGFQTGVSGLMQAVFAFGGPLIYIEFMAEMRRPTDFWKALILAQVLVYTIYLVFGVYVYSVQGEFVVNPAPQGISVQTALKAGNIIGMLSSLIGAALYGNIGIKTLYANVLVEFFRFPPLSRTAGKWIWVPLVPIYWCVALVLAAAIPNFSYLSSLVSAVCILQFTYTFPPILMLGADIKFHAIQDGEGFDPATGHTRRLDHGIQRWIRGAKENLWVNLWNVVFMLGALATAGLGMYASIEGLIAAFKVGRSTSFSCKGPLGAA